MQDDRRLQGFQDHKMKNDNRRQSLGIKTTLLDKLYREELDVLDMCREFQQTKVHIMHCILFSSCFHIGFYSYKIIACIIDSACIFCLGFLSYSLPLHIPFIIPNACEVRPIRLCTLFSLLPSAFISRLDK